MPIIDNYVSKDDSSRSLAATTLVSAPPRIAYLLVDPVTIISPRWIAGRVEQFGHVGPRSPDSARVCIVGDHRSSPSAIHHPALALWLEICQFHPRSVTPITADYVKCGERN